MMGDGSGYGESSKREYTDIFKGSLVLLGTSPRPKTKGEESEPDQIEDYLPPPRGDLPKGTSQREARKMGCRVMMVKGWQ